MADSTQYNPQVGFRIKITKVFQLTPEGVNPATYRLSYTVEGINDLGAMLVVLTSYFLVDYIGTYFTILAVGSGTLDVEDSFRTGECPIANENAIIEKSVGDGLSPFLSSASLQFLHPLAKDNINKWNLDILWKHRLFTYIAYASDDQGTDFTLVNDADLPYMAVLVSDVEIEIPIVTDFVGLWRSGGAALPQVQSDWNQATNTEVDYIKNKPSIPAAQIQSDWNQASNVALDFIKNKPTIPPAQVGNNTYIGLDDTSDTTFTGKDKYVPSANEATGKLDLIETLISLLTLQGDFPSSYVGAALKLLRVNAAATAVEFVADGSSAYADGKVSDTAYNATSWDNVTGIAPSKNAVRDKFEALLTAFIQNQQASAQATTNFWISGEAKAGTAKFGSATDYTEFEADGTIKFVGAATVHDDLTGDITRTKTVGTRVVLNDSENTIDFTAAGTLTDYLFLNYQNRHAWKAGSDIKPHIHFEQASNAVPNFLIEYRWQRQLNSKTTAWSRIICNNLATSYTSGTINNIAYSAGITPPSGYSLSDILQLRIIRDTANTSALFTGADSYSGTVSLTAVDCHIELDTLGSRSEYSK